MPRSSSLSSLPAPSWTLRAGTKIRPGLISAGVVVLATVALMLLFLHNIRTSAFADFEAYYAGASAVRQGESLYTRAIAVRDDEHSMGHPHKPDLKPGLPYVYPPPMAVALLPLTTIPLETASVVWGAINYGLVVATSFVLIRLFFPGHREYWIPAAFAFGVALSVFQPVRASLHWGQADIFLLFSISLAFSSFVARRDRLAGILIGAAIIVKPFFIFLCIYFLWKRAYATVITACLVSSILLGCSMLFVRPQTLMEFVSVASYWSGPIWSVSPGNQSPYGFLLRLFTPNPFTTPILNMPVLVTIARGILGITVLGAFAMLIGRSRPTCPRRQGLEYGFAIVSMLLISPTAQAGHYSYLLVPILALGATLIVDRPGRWMLMASLIGLWLYLSMPGLQGWSMGLYAFHDGPIEVPMLLLTGAHLYALCFLAILTVVVQRRQLSVDTNV